jgi:hypothetical protein
MSQKKSCSCIERALALFEPEERERAQASIQKNIALMKRSIAFFKDSPSPKELRERLLELADAAKVFSHMSKTAAQFVYDSAERHGLDFPSPKKTAAKKNLRQLMSALEIDLRQYAKWIVIPKGAQRPAGSDPHAKAFAVTASANVVQDALDRPDLRHNALVAEFRPSKFEQLAELLFEAITGTALDPEQLRHQIRQYRNDKLPMDYGKNIVFRVPTRGPDREL